MSNSVCKLLAILFPRRQNGRDANATGQPGGKLPIRTQDTGTYLSGRPANLCEVTNVCMSDYFEDTKN
jgi:hypothetical protein